MRQLLALFITINCAIVQAQNFEPAQVTLQELEQKHHDTDSTAPAAILYKIGRTHFEFTGIRWRVITEVACRIKIYNKAGYDYANEEITYNKYGNCIFWDAYTYNEGKDGIEKTALDSTGVFTQPVGKYFETKNIKMPAVREGSIVEYKYKLVSYTVSAMRDWYFEYDIPANYVEYQVFLPVYLSYNRFLTGYINIKETEPVRTVRNAVEENKLTYTAQNVLPYKSEPYINDIKNYIAALRLELASTDYEEGEFVKEFSNSWQAVAKRIYENEYFGKQLESKAYFKKDLRAILKPEMSLRQKTEAIFTFVQQRMSWNAYDDYLCDNGTKEAYALKTGNVADINLILTAMLREAGLDANPVLVSTRANGVALYPSLMAFNYLITAVELEGKTVLLDASGKNTMPDVLPLKAINWVGRIIKSNGMAKETSLMSKIISQEIVNVAATVNADGILAGKARKQYNDYNAMVFRDKITGLNNESCLQLLQEKYTGLAINDYRLINKEDLSKPVTEEYSFTHATVCSSIDGKLYFSPLLFFAETENPFKQENRRYPIDFVFPKRTRYNITITIPDGYSIASFPEAETLALPDDLGNFNYTSTINGNKIQLYAVYEIKRAMISQDNYAALKSFFQQMIAKQNEKIVLKKV